MSTSLCDWCLVDSGCMNFTNECCELRFRANAPPLSKKQYWDSLSASEREDKLPKLVAMVAHVRAVRLEAAQ